uniref:Transposase n=1 Tax=Heterorhabditis bacteriophora TaxID=37862 RepID=A0A1I7XTW6_HETBA
MPIDEDYAGNVFAYCPRAIELDEQLRKSKQFVKIVKDNQIERGGKPSKLGGREKREIIKIA